MDINEIWKAHQSRIAGYGTEAKYYDGHNAHILALPPEKSPDNRIPTPFVRLGVDYYQGYAASPGLIGYTYDNIQTDDSDKDDDFNVLMKDVFKKNDEPLKTSEIYRETLTHGNCFELVYTVESKDPRLTLYPRIAKIPASEFYPFYSDEIEPDLIGGVWFRRVGDYDLASWFYYDENDNAMETLYKKGKNEHRFSVIETRQLPFSMIPISEYMANEYGSPFWSSSKTLVDAFDKITSKIQNEIDRFNLAYLLLPGEVDADFVNNLKSMKVIDSLGDFDNIGNLPRYLERNIPNDFFQGITQNIERLIHKSMKLPDFSDESFAGQQSGIAIKYKLMGMEFQAATIDAYFNKGLQHRFNIIQDLFEKDPKVKGSENYVQLIKHRRNIVEDLQYLANVVKGLIGVVSQETLLSLFPETVIKDVQKEIEMLAIEAGPTEPFGGV